MLRFYKSKVSEFFLIFNRNSETHQYFTRQHVYLHVHRTTIKLGTFDIRYLGVIFGTIWNTRSYFWKNIGKCVTNQQLYSCGTSKLQWRLVDHYISIRSEDTHLIPRPEIIFSVGCLAPSPLVHYVCVYVWLDLVKRGFQPLFPTKGVQCFALQWFVCCLL